jgi:competence protein CoiA
MLVASLGDVRIDAVIAQRGPEYRCPKCKGIVVLKKGRKVIDHFAHKPPTECSWATGETRAHLEAKLLVASALTGRGLKAEVEFVVNTLPGDRRADVMAWSPKGLQIAFELQHTPIDLNEIERRASSYARAGIAQIWIPFLKASVWNEGQPRAGGWFVERYSPRPFERWVHGFNGKRGMWMYDPAAKEFWLGSLARHKIYVEETSWYSEGGEENSAGGFYRWSKRYKELKLEGPYKAENLLIKVERRRAFATKEYSWPDGRVAHLMPV